MRHPVGIFVARALQESIRGRGTYLLRLVLLVALFMALLSTVAGRSMVGAPGLRLFDSIARLDLIVIWLAGPGYFASAITEEKQAGTLGLLKMAGVEPGAMLLGKGGGRLLAAAMLLLVQLPFTVAAVALGGVSLQQVFAAYLALAAFLLFAGSAGLLFSVVSRTTARAAIHSVGFVGFVLYANVWADVLGGGSPYRGVALLLASFSPLGRIDQVMGTAFAGRPIGFQFVSNLLLAAGCFLWALRAFESCTREDPRAAPAPHLATRVVPSVGALAPGRVWDNALAWKEFHFVAGGWLGVLGRFILVGLFPLIMCPVALAWGEIPTMAESGRLIVTVSLTAILIELALATERLFGHERQWHTLTTVMRLPCSPARLIFSKALGASIGLLPYAAWFVIGAALTGFGFLQGLSSALAGLNFWFWLAYGVLFLHMVVYMSLRVRHGALAVGALSALALGLCMLPVAAVSMLIVYRTAVFAVALLAEVAFATWVIQRSIRDRLERTAELE